jgi:hypothetical protein
LLGVIDFREFVHWAFRFAPAILPRKPAIASLLNANQLWDEEKHGSDGRGRLMVNEES